ncbi:MAG TPA: aminotransferase class I/II-fold pyridoxal phosphate-dependent enzyme [Defluviitaleaceae bacterium]|jgi:aminotransferase|nr:aminotransferase class I/II-fold pyridoxal phosphate-dependent enzyme [Candidatus Epulonipiscium sp.]HOQ16574.1 aminotransferase class I/II-fold pyridoxal phosphate-dependent enzyme [Defluviitaleaceae bacterium]HPT75908.1 aminotransferase class I/II-fold pyridoxal phosphate-dependent enzyme [Defluviitaleaceae bacterium]HQD51363.1 aminotransferase class I/II-fold pyridoxal phosphate-dependent enzyme [Defluviitaleaceae bacterium]
MKNLIATKVSNLPPSGIRKFFDIASQMEDVISLGVGEPDFDTPWHIREEGIYTLEKGKTIYTSNSGLLELRQEINRYLSRRFNISYDPQDQILVTVGGSEAIDLVLRAVLNPGDEVLIPEPCFVAYKPCTILAGGVPVTITTKAENDFRLMPEELEAAITEKTKVLILPYPNNPTGAIMEKEDLERIVEVLKDRDILVVSDEIYAELTYGREHVSIASLPGMYEKTLVINGFSKAYSMTGWRMGYAAGPKELIAAMTKIHQYAIMCAPTTSQYAGIEALKNGDTAVAEMRESFDSRRKFVVNGFRSIGMDCFEPLGAFYVFPSIQKSGLTSEEFCSRLLYEEKVAVVPGTAFGDCGEGFIRCSYAYSIDNIKEALRRIEKFMKQFT